MNKRFLTVVVFGVAVSFVCSVLVYRLLARSLSRKPTPVAERVIVASRNLQIGTLLKESDIKFAPWSGAIPKNWPTRPEQVLNRGVVANVYEGEPVLEERLAPTGAGGGLAATIPKGLRAVAVRVNEVVGLAGFVVPGMRVDVIVSANPPTGPGASGMITRTALQNIEVLSADQNMQKDAEGKPVTVQVVNLLVTPEQAEILSLASSETKIQLVLRNPLDTEVASTRGTMLAAVLGSDHPAAPVPPAKQLRRSSPPPPPPAPVKIEFIHGTKREDVTVGYETKARSQENPR